MPDVAVVIPCFNASAHLNGAIESVLSQSKAVSTVLVVDDGSGDQSAAIGESYGAQGWPVRCLRLDRNRGPASARNAAIAQIDEPFVAFLDADDRWTKDHCESLVSLLVDHPDADLAFARTHSTDPGTPDSTLPVPAGQPVEMLEKLLDDNFVPQSAVVARRTSILAAGGYTEGMRYSEDYDLWLRMAHGRRFIASDAPSCIRTSHPGQATHFASKMYHGAWEARTHYSEVADHVGPIVDPDRYRIICARAYERDLAAAWSSRSLLLLQTVLGLADTVPGGEPIRRRWLWRTASFWPLWRLAAYFWDAVPYSVRLSLNEFRTPRRGRLAPG